MATQIAPGPATLPTTTTSLATTVPTHPPLSMPYKPPVWFMGLVYGYMGFGFVIAIAFLLAQFPHTFPWIATSLGWQGDEHARSHGGGISEGGRESEGRSRVEGVSSAVAAPPPASVQRRRRASSSAADGGVVRDRERNRRDLCIETQAPAMWHGLGISMSSRHRQQRQQQQQKRVKKQASVRAAATHGDPPAGPPCQSPHAATAPLPQTKAFLDTLEPIDVDVSDSDDEILRCPDIETGHALPDSRELGDHYGDRRASPYFATASTSEKRDESGDDDAKGWSGRVNRGVYWVADKMAGTLYDRVNGAGEGLLLPVREEEREGWRGRVRS